MMKLKFMAVIALVAITTACNEDTIDVGQTLTSPTDQLEMLPATFTATSRTIVADSVLSRSTTSFLGRIMDPETGATVSSEFMTQLHILESFELYPDDNVVSREDGKPVADSCRFELYFSNPSSACDTLATVKLRLSELEKPMTDGITYYSNYDPEAHGYLRQDGLSIDKMLSYADQSLTEERYKSSSSDGYAHFSYIPLNDEYTDRQGNTYKNYGTYVIQQYYDHPEYFKNSYQFIKHVCPGFYFQITDGYGFYSQVPEIALRIFYTVNDSEKDSISSANFPLAGTEEVLQTCRIYNDKGIIDQMAADNTCTYIKSPAGLFTEVTLPVTDIKSGHDNDSLLAAKVSFQRINNSSNSKLTLDTPVYLLMVQKDSLYSFFQRNKLPDNRLSYYTAYSASGATSNSYTFNNISTLITSMYNAYKNGIAANPNWVARHPDWNKVVLVPISVTSSSSSSITGVNHNMSITSTRLVGGSDNPNDPIQINVVYGQFKK